MAGITSGPPRKPAGARKGHRNYDTVYIDRAEKVVAEVPALADAGHMLQATRDAWQRFWSSPVAKTLVPDSDLPALTRMFHLGDELERCRRAFAEKRLVEGSQGQMVINPLGTFMLAVAKEVRALEDRFGASIVSRLRLSIDLNEATRSLDEMNRRMAADTEAHDDEPDDPRASITAIGPA